MEQVLVDQPLPGVRAIAFNRPQRRNALSTAMYDALRDALAAADADDEVRVVLLAGRGGVFTSGADVGDFRRDRDDGPSPGIRFLQALSTQRKPVVAAVEGFAIGIGTTLLLHCDAVYAEQGSRFRLPFVDLALCPEGASSLLLPRSAGYREAARLLMFGEEFDAETALRAGIVTEVVPAGAAQRIARERAAALAAKPPHALQLTKALLKRGDAQAIAATLDMEAREFARQRQSPEAQEAFAAFLEKRTPDFSRCRQDNVDG